MRPLRLIPILLIALTLAPAADAGWRRSSLFGADVRALIADPAEPDTLYLGTSNGEIYVSKDAAKSWTNPRGGNPFPGYVVDNLALDRTGRLWAACWGLWGGGVVAVSSDGGKNWVRRDAGLEDFSVRALAVDPNDENFILAGGLTGVYRSTDAGRNWEKISEQVNVESLAIDPRTRDRIYIGTWRQGLRSEDGGSTWNHINQGMVLDTDMFSITIDTTNPDSVWVATCGWVYNTKNRGDLWTRYRDGFNNRRIHDVKIDPCAKDRVYAGSVAGLYRSEDGGKLWYPVSDEGLVINSIVLHGQRPNRVIIGVEGDGVYVSNDGSKTFARTSEGLRNLRVTSVVADPLLANRIYASVAFGGNASGIYISKDGGGSWERVSNTRLPEVLSLTVTAQQDVEARFIAGTERGIFWSRDGESWQQSAPVNLPLRVSRIVRFNKQRIFCATSEGVLTSRDGGKSWYRLAEASERTIDIALGQHRGSHALFALTAGGIQIFDGDRWAPVQGSPARGSSLATQTTATGEIVYVAGLHGVKAGTIDEDLRWKQTDVPDAPQANVMGGGRDAASQIFLTSRQQREILIGERGAGKWLELAIPTRTAEISSIALDPFAPDRYFVATLGEGIFIHEGAPRQYVARTTSGGGSAPPAGSQQR